MKNSVYNEKAEKVQDIELPEEMFGMRFNPGLIHQVLLAQSANARVARAHTKDRGEVRGGGKKPWRQKGTGRARHGSTRSPLWVGGGVTFGPTKERNFSQKINRKMKRNALFSALSQKLRDKEIFFLTGWAIEEPKTKLLNNFIMHVYDTVISSDSEYKKLPATLLVHEGSDILIRAVRNIPRVTALRGDSLNVGDILKHQSVLFSLEGLKLAKETYLPAEESGIKKRRAKAVKNNTYV